MTLWRLLEDIPELGIQTAYIAVIGADTFTLVNLLFTAGALLLMVISMLVRNRAFEHELTSTQERPILSIIGDIKTELKAKNFEHIVDDNANDIDRLIEAACRALYVSRWEALEPRDRVLAVAKELQVPTHEAIDLEAQQTRVLRRASKLPPARLAEAEELAAAQIELSKRGDDGPPFTATL